MWIDDLILRRCAEPLALACWIPERPMVVLGSSNLAEVEAEVARCATDGIEVLQRYGGGGTVLLHGGCVVVSVGVWVRQLYQNKLYFERLNQAVIHCLAARWSSLGDLGQRGLSDITFGDQKVAGTSLFRSRNYLLYQASLLVETRADDIARYLRHPSREPDYRAGRSHGSFLTGLADIVPGLTPEACLAQLEAALAPWISQTLGAEQIAPEPGQFAGLWSRVARAAQA